MTFDFAPGWLDGLVNTPDYATPTPRSATAASAAAVQSAYAATPCAPSHPTADQMARLVGELFTEGSLSFEQLCSLSHAPELNHLLGDTVAQVVPARRVAAPKRR